MAAVSIRLDSQEGGELLQYNTCIMYSGLLFLTPIFATVAPLRPTTPSAICQGASPTAIVRSYYISAARRDVQGAEACLTATFRHMEAQSTTPDWKSIASIHLTYVREHPFDPAKAPGEIRQRPVRLVQVTVGYIVRWRTITTTPNGPGIRFIYVEKEHAASPWRIGSIGSGP